MGLSKIFVCVTQLTGPTRLNIFKKPPRKGNFLSSQFQNSRSQHKISGPKLTIHSTMHIFEVGFIKRGPSALDSSHDFDVVFFGALVIKGTQLLVYESDEFESEGEDATIKFSTHLSLPRCFKCYPIQSAHGRYDGGRILMFGTFDRNVDERITMDMSAEVYAELVPAMQSARLAATRHVSFS